MAIHKVKNPFFCRMNQFASKGYPGRVLVVGIARDALREKEYKMQIGSNPAIYEAYSADILTVAHPWKNRKGKLVMITPVDLFKKIEKQT